MLSCFCAFVAKNGEFGMQTRFVAVETKIM